MEKILLTEVLLGIIILMLNINQYGGIYEVYLRSLRLRLQAP